MLGEAGEVVLPWEPAVPQGSKTSLGCTRACFVVAGDTTTVPSYYESGVNFFVTDSFKFVLRRGCKHDPFVFSVILGLNCLFFILKRIFESFSWFSWCL